MSRLRRACALVLLALLAAGCTSNESLRTLSENDSNASAACADACPVDVTPTTPFHGVAGTPASPSDLVAEASPSPTATTPATPADATPPEAPSPAADASNATASTPADPSPTIAANATTNDTPNATTPPTVDAAPTANETAAVNTTTPATPPVATNASTSAPANVTSSNATMPPGRGHRTRAGGGVPRVSVLSKPIRADGSATGSARWGGWQARAGDRGVGGTSYIAIQNTGNISDPVVTIQFDTPSFVGQTDPTWLIPIAGNIEFAAFEDREASNASAPAKGRFDFQPATGSTITVQFHGEANILYVAYRIVSLPTPLPAQSYSTPYTVSVA